MSGAAPVSNDDMNATPLSKLVPQVQSKSDAPRVEAAPSYAEIMRDMEKQHPAPAMQAAPMQGSPMPMQAAQMQAAPMDAAPGQQQATHAPVVVKKKVRFEEFDSDDDDDDYGHRHQRRRPLPPPEPPAGMGAQLLAWLREYRASLLVVILVFALLAYGVPRLQRTTSLQVLLGPTGALNTFGAALLALATGGTFAVATRLG